MTKENQYIRSLIRRLDGRYDNDRTTMTNSEWICQNTKLRGRPFSFDGYEFQRQIVDDEHPNLNVIKCSQVGLTEVQVRRALAFVKRNLGVSALFSLPNEKMFKRVSKTRIQPLVSSEKVFNLDGEKTSNRSMDLIQVSQSFLYVTGCTEGDATSNPVDALFHDEVDLSPQDMLGLFQSRIQNSDYKITNRFSTPTFTNFGIDKHYQVSDQREYVVSCSSCNHVQVPKVSFDSIRIPGLKGEFGDITDLEDSDLEDVDLEQAYLVCIKCRKPLDLTDASRRFWLATYPSRTNVRGYQIRPFSTVRLPPSYVIGQMLQYKRDNNLRRWSNTVCGEAGNTSDERLSEQQVKACMTGGSVPEVARDTPVFAGIDQGLTCHIVLGTRRGAFRFVTVPADDLKAKVDELRARYNIVSGCIDRLPYTPTANEVRDRSSGRIIPVEYTAAGAKIQAIKDESGDVTHARINRTRVLDELASAIRNRQIELAGYTDQQLVLIEHLRDMFREEEPEKPAKWVKLNGNDHYFHALSYMYVASKVHEVVEEASGIDRRVSIMAMTYTSSANTGDRLVGTTRHSVLGRY